MPERTVNLVEEPQPPDSKITVGVLALQGAFAEHINMLRRLGVKAVSVRVPADLEGVAALIIPGGESTTIGKLARRWGLVEPLKAFIRADKPVWGTCAGLILLAKEISQTSSKGGASIVPPRLAMMDIQVDRNAYGRQLNSFEANLFAESFLGPEPFPAVFIRAPRITAIGPAVKPLLYYENNVVAARQAHIFVTTFHPELTGDIRLHRYFLSFIDS